LAKQNEVALKLERSIDTAALSRRVDYFVRFARPIGLLGNHDNGL
jgi:hypothetical protein